MSTLIGLFRTLWATEPVRLLYVVAIALTALADNLLLGNSGFPLVQAVVIAVIGEISRQRVSPV